MLESIEGIFSSNFFVLTSRIIKIDSRNELV